MKEEAMKEFLDRTLGDKYSDDVKNSIENVLHQVLICTETQKGKPLDMEGAPDHFQPETRNLTLSFPKFVWKHWDGYKNYTDKVKGYEMLFMAILLTVSREVIKYDSNAYIDTLALMVKRIEGK